MLGDSITGLKLFLTFILILLINISTFAQKTDVVRLLNGDKITGEVKYLRVGILTYSTDNMESVSIQWNKIKSIETKNFFEIEVADGRVFFGSIAPSDDEGMMIVKGVTLDHNLFMKYIVRINRIKESFWDILDGYIKFGFSFTKASQIGQISFGGNAKYRTKINVSELSLNSVITTTEKEPTSSKNDLSFSYQHNLEQQWFAAGIAALQENSELGIKLRTSLGGGLGNNIIQSQNQWLYTLAGLSINRELKTDQTEATFNVEGLINAQYQLFKYDHPKANLLTYIYIFPSLTDLGRYRFNYNAQLSWEIFIDFYWDLTFYYEYDNAPQSANSSQSDYRIDTSIKFEF
ncbi:MAG: DUF481 domain-containing protein [Ignavibacteriaceae bacterium]|nr:DUF481 domain-containing protein [Ignavibacteriaceae bacterium]